MNDIELDLRLRALVERAPAVGRPPSVARRRRPMVALPAAVAVVLVLGVAATASGAASVLRQAVMGYEGVENPGQPLHGAGLECMSPPAAAAYLAEHGFINVVWQVESGDPSVKGETTTIAQSAAPEHGYVIPAAILDDGKLHVVVDQRVGAVGAGNCGAMAMP
jgi:hypothetical protein